MIFGKIDYLNLLPFYVFLKRSSLQNSFKKSIEFKKDVPSRLNKALYRKKIDSAVISSIESRRKKYKKLDMGVVAKKQVISVLVRKNSTFLLDPASMTSNMLSKVLKLKGEVIIGDRALKAYLCDGKDEFYDMGEVWNKKRNLPFVFARFCYTKNGDFYKKIVSKFLETNVKIPQYILQNYSKSREISPKNIKWYLKYITYKINKKEKMALKIFLQKARVMNFNPLQH